MNNNNVKQCWFQVNPTANPVPLPYDVTNEAALRVKRFKIGEVEYLRRQYTNELFDLSNNFVGWAYNNTEFKAVEVEYETDNDSSDNEEEDNIVICSKCNESVDCLYDNIYIVNNQKEGDEFQEDTCCGCCWAVVAKSYKRNSWAGDDLDDVSDDEEDFPPCCCTTKTDIRGRCDAIRSAPQFAKCPARVDTALFHIENDYQIYQELALHRDVSEKSEIIARVASEAPYNFSGGGDSLWTGDVEKIVDLYQTNFQKNNEEFDTALEEMRSRHAEEKRIEAERRTENAAMMKGLKLPSAKQIQEILKQSKIDIKNKKYDYLFS
jgi:hypothetical protein